MFPMGWDPKSLLHPLSPAFQPSLKVLHAHQGRNTIFTHLGIQQHPLRAPRSCCLGSIRRWSGCNAQPGEVVGLWQWLQGKAERQRLSLAQGSIPNQPSHKTTWSLQRCWEQAMR